MKNNNLLWIIIGLLMLSGCREEQLDMTVMHKSPFDGATITEISVSDAWNVTIVQDDQTPGLELEYSAFMEEYLNVKLTGSSLSIGFTRYLSLPHNTVMNAIIHTPDAQKITLSEAVTAVIDGQFSPSSLTMELHDASTCKGGDFMVSGNVDLKLYDASTMADFSVHGERCSIELDDASVFKGWLYPSDTLVIRLDDASRMTTYGGTADWADVEVNSASFLNMLKTSVLNKIHIEVTEASEASVALSAPAVLEGLVRDASKLYYQGNPILNVDCDESSMCVPL